MGSRTWTMDRKLLMADGAAPLTASGIAQVSGANAILDMGGAPNRTDLGIVGGYARNDMAVVIDVSAITVGATNIYRINVLGSNVIGMTASVVLGSIQLGNTAVMPNGGSTSVAGRYELFFTTEQADINYEFIALYVEAIGTTPSITFTAEGVILPDAW